MGGGTVGTGVAVGSSPPQATMATDMVRTATASTDKIDTGLSRFVCMGQHLQMWHLDEFQALGESIRAFPMWC